MIQGTEKPINEYEKESIPPTYLRLFNAISDTSLTPTIKEMEEVIRIVWEDFPKENNTNY